MLRVPFCPGDQSCPTWVPPRARRPSRRRLTGADSGGAVRGSNLRSADGVCTINRSDLGECNQGRLTAMARPSQAKLLPCRRDDQHRLGRNASGNIFFRPSGSHGRRGACRCLVNTVRSRMPMWNIFDREKPYRQQLVAWSSVCPTLKWCLKHITNRRCG